ncbi:MAG: RpiB/LacA/LacB family sugar-phosphate isomerase [Candidatus Pacebacteria bacterium]|nr:RpiB/LacA/LacB family sugar-phosphate isomerase [Candidatus Paceibacterota bacterium]
MKIYLATDHAGFELKEAIKLFLEIEKDELKDNIEKSGQVISNIEIVDFGAYKYEETDDYPNFISVCAGALSSDIYTGIKNNMAIVFGGSGEGEVIVADKYKGIRAGVLNNENMEIVRLLREHNNANILSIGARFVSEAFAKEAVKAFLITKFEEKDSDSKISRHERRIDEIEDIEISVNAKINKEEIEELKIFQEMRDVRNDN